MRQRQTRPSGNDVDFVHDWEQEKKSHRGFVGPAHIYDLRGAGVFSMLFQRGLREDHYVLDVGCGSLRVGRFLIQYLQRGHYYGIEPHQSLVRDAIRAEIGPDLVRIRDPKFFAFDDFKLSRIEECFDCIIAHSIFIHAPADDVRNCLAEACIVLQHDGEFFFDFRKGEKDNDKAKWSYPETVTYRIETMRDWVIQAGLIAEEFEAPKGLWRHWMSCRRYQKPPPGDDFDQWGEYQGSQHSFH